MNSASALRDVRPCEQHGRRPGYPTPLRQPQQTPVQCGDAWSKFSSVSLGTARRAKLAIFFASRRTVARRGRSSSRIYSAGSAAPGGLTRGTGVIAGLSNPGRSVDHRRTLESRNGREGLEVKSSLCDAVNGGCNRLKCCWCSLLQCCFWLGTSSLVFQVRKRHAVRVLG